MLNIFEEYRILWWIESSKEQHVFQTWIFIVTLCNDLLSLLVNLMHPFFKKADAEIILNV